MSIKNNVRKILSELPRGIELVIAAKTRTPAEILETIEAGAKIIGENYVQEAQKAFDAIGKRAKWHLIGHLQLNKVKKAVKIFDLIETVDSFKTAEEINKECQKENKIMPILIEINSAKELQKAGILPEDVEELVRRISNLKNLRISGLMTIGPETGNPEDARPYFAITKTIFDNMKSMNLPNLNMMYLSMGMSNSYQIAIEEGANVIRIGTKIFGERKM